MKQYKSFKIAVIRIRSYPDTILRFHQPFQLVFFKIPHCYKSVKIAFYGKLIKRVELRSIKRHFPEEKIFYFIDFCRLFFFSLSLAPLL